MSLSREKMLEFIHMFVSSNENLSIVEDDNFKMANDVIGHKISILNVSGDTVYSGIGSGDGAANNAISHLFAVLMQRLTLSMCGYVYVTESGSIDIAYDQSALGIVVNDQSAKTLTVTLVLK